MERLLYDSSIRNGWLFSPRFASWNWTRRKRRVCIKACWWWWSGSSQFTLNVVSHIHHVWWRGFQRRSTSIVFWLQLQRRRTRVTVEHSSRGQDWNFLFVFVNCLGWFVEVLFWFFSCAYIQTCKMAGNCCSAMQFDSKTVSNDSTLNTEDRHEFENARSAKCFGNPWTLLTDVAIAADALVRPAPASAHQSIPSLGRFMTSLWSGVWKSWWGLNDTWQQRNVRRDKHTREARSRAVYGMLNVF